MRMHKLAATPSWDWPPDVDAEILAVLNDRRSLQSERVLAAELAGDPVVMNDAVAENLIRILESDEEPESLRSQAAISFGPLLEESEIQEYEEDNPLTVSPGTLERAKRTLRTCVQDSTAPKLLRRRALEAAVRSDAPWHGKAVRAAYRNSDPEWKLTALFCMRYVPGFGPQIIETLESGDPDLLHEAVGAAGDQGLNDAWPHIRALVDAGAAGAEILPEDPEGSRSLLVTAMHAVAAIRPQDAAGALQDIVDSEDEELSEAALDALAWLHAFWDDPELGEEPTWH